MNMIVGVEIDNKLNFNLHVSDICKKAAAQLNAIYGLKNFLSIKAKSILIHSFVFANFNYCPLVWNFSSFKSPKKVEDIQKRALRFLHDDNESSYEELLIQTGKNSMNVNRLKSLCIEIFKTINDMNPCYWKDIFELAVKQLFFYYKQPVYKQLGLELQKVKQLLGLKHVTISNFSNNIFAYENITTTLHNHISVYCTIQMSFFF